MTNAERQKRYRDRKRGGPPAGRWAGRPSVAKIAAVQHVSRTMIFMASWVRQHAPDVAPRFVSGELKVSPTYRRLRGQYVLALCEALQSRPETPGVRLVESWEDGRFVFRWVKDAPAPGTKKGKRS